MSDKRRISEKRRLAEKQEKPEKAVSPARKTFAWFAVAGGIRR